MLGFFRKYQRYVFLFVAVITILSFAFFGTYSTIGEVKEIKDDPRVSIALDGTPIKMSEIQNLSRFLATDQDDILSLERIPNFCNNGVLRKDILQTGVANLLATSYFKYLQEDLRPRLERVKRYHPYRHPRLPALGVEALWDRLAPSMRADIASIKEAQEPTLDLFIRLSRIYLQQGAVSSSALRNILLYQQQQLGLPMDPALQGADLALFGFHSLVDWFGQNFLTITSQFILNGARVAKEKGYDVSFEEAKGDLLANFEHAIAKYFSDDKTPRITFADHLRALGFEENQAVEIWQKVLLFRRYFQSVSQAAYIDRLPFVDFLSFARESASVALYQWPEGVFLKNFEDLIQFETYLRAVSAPLSNPLGVPEGYYPLEKITEESPELVQAIYSCKIKEVPLAHVGARAKIKEVWQWEIEQAHWTILKQTFSFLPDCSSCEERFGVLESLSAAQRADLDAFARAKLAELHPEWLEEAFSQMPFRDIELGISKASCSLLEVKKPWRLFSLLEKQGLGEGDAQNKLHAYTDGGQIFYRIEEPVKIENARLLTFDEARKQGILSKMADHAIRLAYPKVRAKDPKTFQTKEGAWKPLSETRVEIARAIYPAIEALEKTEKKVWTPQMLAQQRLYFPIKDFYKALCNNPEESCFIADASQRDVANQFKLEKKELLIERASPEEWMKENAFMMMPREFSPITVLPNGGFAFFYLMDRKPCEHLVLDRISVGKEFIAADAQLYLAEKLLASIEKNHSIVLAEEESK